MRSGSLNCTELPITNEQHLRDFHVQVKKERKKENESHYSPILQRFAELLSRRVYDTGIHGVDIEHPVVAISIHEAYLRTDIQPGLGINALSFYS